VPGAAISKAKCLCRPSRRFTGDQFSRRHDFAGFFEQELEFRQQLDYPPFSRVALLTLKGRNEDKVKFSAEHVRRELVRIEPANRRTGEPAKGGTLVSPSRFAASPIRRSGFDHRRSCSGSIATRRNLLSLPDHAAHSTDERAQPNLSRIIQSLALPEDVTLSVDIDPVDLT